MRGQYQVFRRQDYVRTYARTCTQWVYFNIIMYYTLHREKLNMKTGVRTTQHRMEKVRRELHLPTRYMYHSTSILDVPTECYIVT